MAEPVKYLASSLALLPLLAVVVTKVLKSTGKIILWKLWKSRPQDGGTEECCPKFLLTALEVMPLNVRSGLWGCWILGIGCLPTYALLGRWRDSRGYLWKQQGPSQTPFCLSFPGSHSVITLRAPRVQTDMGITMELHCKD